MKFRNLALGGAILLGSAVPASANMLEKLNIDELTNRSDAVFRGTVTDIEQSSISAGGGEIPAIIYRLRVEELLKGTADIVKGDDEFMEIRMVGSIKSSSTSGNTVRFSIFEDVPKLSMGSDYVLFMTPESSAGLSVTVGLGQGAFNVVPSDKEDMVVNGYSNDGLDLGSGGAISYSQLKSAVAAAGN